MTASQLTNLHHVIIGIHVYANGPEWLGQPPRHVDHFIEFPGLAIIPRSRRIPERNRQSIPRRIIEVPRVLPEPISVDLNESRAAMKTEYLVVVGRSASILREVFLNDDLASKEAIVRLTRFSIVVDSQPALEQRVIHDRARIKADQDGTAQVGRLDHAREPIQRELIHFGVTGQDRQRSKGILSSYDPGDEVLRIFLIGDELTQRITQAAIRLELEQVVIEQVRLPKAG